MANLKELIGGHIKKFAEERVQRAVEVGALRDKWVKTLPHEIATLFHTFLITCSDKHFSNPGLGTFGDELRYELSFCDLDNFYEDDPDRLDYTPEEVLIGGLLKLGHDFRQTLGLDRDERDCVIHGGFLRGTYEKCPKIEKDSPYPEHILSNCRREVESLLFEDIKGIIPELISIDIHGYHTPGYDEHGITEPPYHSIRIKLRVRGV